VALTQIPRFQSVQEHTLGVIQLKVGARAIFGVVTGVGDATEPNSTCLEEVDAGSVLTKLGYGVSGTYRSMLLRVEHPQEMRTGYRANRGVHSPPNVTMGGPSQPIPPPGNEVLSYSVKVLYYDIGDG